jgi:sarcosine oxidase subunit beta
MVQTIFDSIVIGGGVIGSSIAYHLAKQGRHVLVTERTESAVEPAASWASAGGVRRQGRHPAEARLAIEAIQRWQTLSQELDADLHYRQDGNLLLAETDAEAEELQGFVQQQHEHGFGDVQLLDRHQVRTIVPALAEQVVAGSFSPADGQADPMLTTRAFAAAAHRHGAIYWNHTEATHLLMSGQRIIGLQTQQGAAHAEQIILAAGAWSDTLAATVGIRLPISMQALQMVLSTPAPTPVLKPVVSALHRMLSLKQLNDGSFLLGGGWLGEPSPDRRSYTMIQEHIQGNWMTACELLPAVAQHRIARAWCGLEAHSIDDLPFIGAVPGVDGLLLALGFSGHGFANAPAVGRCVADLIAGRATPELDGLRPDRISMFEDVSKQSI